jgi:hypothetical protein
MKEGTFCLVKGDENLKNINNKNVKETYKWALSKQKIIKEIKTIELALFVAIMILCIIFIYCYLYVESLASIMGAAFVIVSSIFCMIISITSFYINDYTADNLHIFKINEYKFVDNDEKILLVINSNNKDTKTLLYDLSNIEIEYDADKTPFVEMYSSNYLGDCIEDYFWEVIHLQKI